MVWSTNTINIMHIMWIQYYDIYTLTINKSKTNQKNQKTKKGVLISKIGYSKRVKILFKKAPSLQITFVFSVCINTIIFQTDGLAV